MSQVFHTQPSLDANRFLTSRKFCQAALLETVNIFLNITRLDSGRVGVWMQFLWLKRTWAWNHHVRRILSIHFCHRALKCLIRWVQLFYIFVHLHWAPSYEYMVSGSNASWHFHSAFEYLHLLEFTAETKLGSPRLFSAPISCVAQTEHHHLSLAPFLCVCVFQCWILSGVFIFIYFAALSSLHDLSSRTRDQTQAAGRPPGNSPPLLFH